MASITIRFGNNERSDDGIGADWIQDQIRARRAANEPACGVVTITADAVDIRLATGDCPSGPRVAALPGVSLRRPRSCLTHVSETGWQYSASAWR